MGRAVAPSLTRSSWIRWKSNLVRNNVNETSFIVVRHPFERLVSAYRDKLERTHAKNYLTDWYFKQYGQKIVKKYRAKAISIFGSDFFRYIKVHTDVAQCAGPENFKKSPDQKTREIK